MWVKNPASHGKVENLNAANALVNIAEKNSWSVRV
jgi:hypothetical protein